MSNILIVAAIIVIVFIYSSRTFSHLYLAGIAGIRVVRIKQRLASNLKKDIHWPEPKNNFVLFIGCGNGDNCYESYEKAHEVLKDLWLNLAEKRGTGFQPKDCFFNWHSCVWRGVSSKEYRELLLFYLRNIELEKSNHAPITNPIWISDKDNSTNLRIEMSYPCMANPELLRGDQFEDAFTPQFTISSNKSIDEDLVSNLIMYDYKFIKYDYSKYGRFARIMLPEGTHVVKPTADMIKEAESWHSMVIDRDLCLSRRLASAPLISSLLSEDLRSTKS